MITENLFAQAVAKGDTKDFFRGHGVYFVRDPDWGVHVHGAHLSGWVEKYINSEKKNAGVFDAEFKNFINSAKEESDDINHVFSMLSAYFATKKRGLLSRSTLFEGDNSEGRCAILQYLERIKESNVLVASKNDILIHANFIESKGFGFVKIFVETLFNN